MSAWGLPATVEAKQVGVTAAVRPDVEGTPPEQETRILSVGVDLFADERIRTGKRGQTHLLFVDGSSLTVGPSAELILDHFVYDPDTKTGDLVITASKGLMRFVGGRLSKTKPVLIKTPTAVIGIRGGVAMMQIGDGPDAPPTSVTMLFGDEVFMESNGQRQTMNRPGFQLAQNPDGGVNPPRQVSQQELSQQLQSLEEPVPGEEGENLGDIAPAAGGGVSDEDVAGTQLATLGSNNDPNGGGAAGGGAPGNTAAQRNTTTASQREALESMTSSGGETGNAVTPVGAPIDNDVAENQIIESAENGTPIGITALAQNVDPGDIITYSLTDDADGRFTIDPQTGVISVRDSSLLDAETAQSFTITVQASKQGDGVASETFTVNIGDDNTEYSITDVSDNNGTSNSLNHGSAAGVLANITALASDQDVTDNGNIGYSLSDNGGDRFQINSQTGVVTTSGVQPIDFKSNRRHTIAITAQSPDGSTDTSNFTVEVLYNNFQGRVKQSGNDMSVGTLDGNTNHNVALEGVVLGFGDLSANVDLGEGGIGNIGIRFPDSSGEFSVGAATNWAFGTVVGSSAGVLNSQQSFVYYEIFDTQFSGRALLFAGDPATSLPTTGVTGYDLTRDFVRDQRAPFLDGLPTAIEITSGNVYIAWNDDAANSQRAVGGGLVFIDGSGTNQDSGGFFITGRVQEDEGVSGHIGASVFGQSRTNTAGQSVFYGGGLASSDAGDGSDFFGASPDAFVLESATVNSEDTISSRGIDKIVEGTTQSAAFFANSVAMLQEEVSLGTNRTTQTLNGFASGIEVRTNGGSTILGDGHVFAQGNAASNVAITTDASRNTVDAVFHLEDASERSVVYTFGAANGDGSSAFIEDGRFYARENAATVSGNSVNVISGLATNDIAVFANGALPNSVNLCSCEHLAWGFWGAQRQDSMGSGNLANTHLATWVAGSLASTAQVINSNQMATYSGHVIGNVAAVDDATDHYVAVGNISLNFTFNPGSFTLDQVAITDFDGRNYSSSSSGGSSFSTNAYSSSTAGLTISDGAGRHASLNGAFFGGQAAPAVPLATGGQGEISGPNYTARFTYAAEP